MREKFLAIMVSMVAPQTPTLLYGSFELKRQGPIEQFLQQAESAPIGHGFISLARWNAVSTPSLSAFANIKAVESHIVISLTGNADDAPSFFSFFLSMISLPD
jgi:hypothetical protein